MSSAYGKGLRDLCILSDRDLAIELSNSVGWVINKHGISTDFRQPTGPRDAFYLAFETASKLLQSGGCSSSPDQGLEYP